MPLDRSRYFDNAATTPLDPRVVAEMLPYLEEDFGNANSIHEWGRRAREGVELARERVAKLFGGSPDEIFFTSGATEANNWILSSFKSVAVSPFEHSSVWEAGIAKGFDVLDNEGYRLYGPRQSTDLLSVMVVCNESGAILELPEVGETTPSRVHRDATQALGKVPLNLADMDYASASAHKLYGPKGIGCLYVRDARPLPPMLFGGEQESGMRGGTLNVPAIVGFGAACAIALDQFEEDRAHAQELRQAFVAKLQGTSDWKSNCHDNNSPFILCLSFLGVQGETLVVEMDAAGFAISSGSACSSHSSEPSHFLESLGLPSRWSRGTVRIGFGRFNTLDQAERLATSLVSSVESLRALAK
ncbi:MAG: cysteine desulfurase [Fimbriimonadaceae bacterium]|nr:cysteine desulfurase [Fimbriimonadaceae bacterium]QYK55391.1 MAG: cysteine desulfurase [Fimbriimonadaceae bacterium]